MPIDTSIISQPTLVENRSADANSSIHDARSLQPAPGLGIRWYLYFPVVCVACFMLVPQVQIIFADTGWRWLHILMLALTLSYSLTPLMGIIARRYKVLDLPSERKVHKQATPLLGGTAVFFGFSVSLLTNGIFSIQLGVILAAAFVLFVVGVLDDVREISAGAKLSTQIICTIGVMASGIVLRVLPYHLGIFSEIGNYLLTIFWIIGITNAMNFFDGMDGLATGLGAAIAFFLGIVAFQTAQPFLGWVAVAMMGACLGFLPFNFKFKGGGDIFLGDAGSTVIGFVLACVAVYGDWATANPVVALVSPLLIFWILIFDMVHISIERILTGKVYNFKQWIAYVGKDHLHHRLAYALGTNQRSVLFIFLMNFCLGISAISLRNASWVDAILLILQAAIFVILITILERRGRLAGDQPLEEAHPINKTNPAIKECQPSAKAVGKIHSEHKNAAIY